MGDKHVVIIGAGMGGLSAAIRLARAGMRVTIVEARQTAGGLASGFELEGFRFDAGPYILLDLPGLEWSFRELGLRIEDHLHLERLKDVYEVTADGAGTIRFHADLQETARGFELLQLGTQRRYLRFIERTVRIHRKLSPLLSRARPRPVDLLRAGALSSAPFLLRSLGSVLNAAGLPAPIRNAIGIWTHIAAQQLDEAPSPLGFVPGLIHTVGAQYPRGGIGRIPEVLAAVAVELGVEFRFGTKVRRIMVEAGRATGVETDDGEHITGDAVLSNYSGVGTYLEMTDGVVPVRDREGLAALPLQSPGACAYMAVRGVKPGSYLRFRLPDNGELCRLLILPSIPDPSSIRDGWSPARLLAPMRYDEAEKLGPSGQRDFLERLLEERWWRDQVDDARVLATRIPAEWGSAHHLYRESMNPVMTASFMRAGRIPHRSPWVERLYLAGSSTHPGQWVSFCAISGVLAADILLKDLH